MSFSQAELADFATNLFVNYDEGFEGDTPLTDELIARVEEELGYSLPIDYIALMRLKNGGSLKRCFFRYTDTDGYECELIVRGIYGIGFAIAEALASAGATIVFNDRHESGVEKGLANYAEKGIKAYGYVCDVTDEPGVQEMVKKIEAEVGVIDILVNNAGIIKRIGC